MGPVYLNEITVSLELIDINESVTMVVSAAEGPGNTSRAFVNKVINKFR